MLITRPLDVDHLGGYDGRRSTLRSDNPGHGHVPNMRVDDIVAVVQSHIRLVVAAYSRSDAAENIHDYSVGHLGVGTAQIRKSLPDQVHSLGSLGVMFIRRSLLVSCDPQTGSWLTESSTPNTTSSTRACPARPRADSGRRGLRGLSSTGGATSTMLGTRRIDPDPINSLDMRCDPAASTFFIGRTVENLRFSRYSLVETVARTRPRHRPPSESFRDPDHAFPST